MEHHTVVYKNGIRTFRRNEYKCKECNVTFLHRENYLIHYDLHHCETKKLWCC